MITKTLSPTGDYTTLQDCIAALNRSLNEGVGLYDNITIKVARGQVYGSVNSYYLLRSNWNGWGIKFIADEDTTGDPPIIWGRFILDPSPDNVQYQGAHLVFERVVLGAISDCIVESRDSSYASDLVEVRDCLVYLKYAGITGAAYLVKAAADTVLLGTVTANQVSFFISNAPAVVGLTNRLTYGNSGNTILCVFPSSSSSSFDLPLCRNDTILAWAYGVGKTIVTTGTHVTVGDPKLKDYVIQASEDTPGTMVARSAQQTTNSSNVLYLGDPDSIWDTDINGNYFDDTNPDLGAYASVSSSSYLINPNGPTVSLSDYPTTSASGVPFDLTITFSESVYAFSPVNSNDLFVTNATKSNAVLVTADPAPTVWTVTITPLDDDTLTMQVPTNSCTSIATGETNNPSETVSLNSTGSSVEDPPEGSDPLGDAGISPTVTIDRRYNYFHNGSTPFDIWINFGNTAGVENWTNDKLEVSGAIASDQDWLVNYTSRIATITPSASGLITINIPASSAYNISDGEPTTAATTVLVPYLIPPVLTMGGPTAVYSVSPFEISFTWNMNVISFIPNDIYVTNGTLTNFAGLTPNHTATITPNGNGDITIFVPSGVAWNAVNQLNEQEFEQTILYNPETDAVGGVPTSGTSPIGNSGTILDSSSSVSGVYTSRYNTAFDNYGKDIQLVYFEAKKDKIGAAPLGWSTLRASGKYIDGHDLAYYDDYYDYERPVLYTTKSFLDFDSKSLSTTTSIQKSLSKNQVYGIDIDTGKIYLPPNVRLETKQQEYTPYSGGVQWAKSTYLVMQDVWIFMYNNSMYHIQKTQPRYLANQIVFYESEFKKIGLKYDPFSFLYDGGLYDPTGASGTINGQLAGGYYFPLDGGFY